MVEKKIAEQDEDRDDGRTERREPHVMRRRANINSAPAAERKLIGSALAFSRLSCP
jgi:hypothetical protein